jgi:hypothetical protein
MRSCRLTLTVPVFSCVGCVPAADVEYVVEGYEKLQDDLDCTCVLLCRVCTSC